MGLIGYYGIGCKLLFDCIINNYDLYNGFCPIEFIDICGIKSLVEYDDVNLYTIITGYMEGEENVRKNKSNI